MTDSLLNMSSFTTADFEYMRKAITLAQKGIYTTDPNPRVGCVVVKDEEIIGEGWHQKAGEPHAEVNALLSCCKSAEDLCSEIAEGSTVYVTLEPCSHFGRTPPCADRLVEAKVKRVVIAMQDPNPQVAGNGIKKLEDAGIQVEVGLMQQEAEQLNPGFIKRMQTGLPFVRCKMAMSLDGRTAMASGESKWITADEAREDVHRLRARSSAIITGIGSILHDDPQMNARLKEEHSAGKKQDVKQPLRVVIDPNLQIVETARIFGDDLNRHSREGGNPEKEVVILSCEKVITTNAEKVKLLEQKGAKVVSAKMLDSEKMDLQWVVECLGSEGVNELMVEAGSILSGAFLQAGLIDELLVYMAPHIMGSAAKGLFDLPGLDKMADKVELDIMDIRAVGKDWRIVAKPIKN